MTIDKSFDDKSLPVVSATEPVSPQNALDRCLTCYAFTLSKIEASLLWQKCISSNTKIFCMES